MVYLMPMLLMFNCSEKLVCGAAVALCLKCSIEDVVVFGKSLVYQIQDFTPAASRRFFYINMRAHCMDI